MQERSDRIGLQRESVLMLTSRISHSTAVLLLLLCLTFLLANFFGWAAEMIGAILYPLQLNYGEGIVWQQADMILRGEGYRPLSDDSFIVFHYPPLYHFVSALLAKALGLNWLMVGRTVSVLSTLGIAFLIGALTFQAVRSRESNLIGLICATLAALVVFTLLPVAYWSPLARVDMISILLSLAGVWFGLRSIELPRSVFPAALFFVLALFAKQTAISAALAMFFVLLCLRPAMAWLGVLLAAGLGLAIFTALTLSTSGEFIKHIIGYNANRFTFGNIGMMSYVLVLHSILLIIVYSSIARFMRELRSRPAGLNAISALRMRAANDRFETVRLFAIVLFGFGALSSLAIVKTGASFNYLLEWMLSWALLVGLALREPARFVIGTLSRGSTAADMPPRVIIAIAALTLQVAGVPTAVAVRILNLPDPPLGKRIADHEQRRELQELVRTIRETAAPVISDDMVAVKMAGKEVVWEPAIFAELTATGQWDEKPFLEFVRQKRFGFIVTEGEAQDNAFKARYRSSLLRAIDENYPRKERLAGYRLHWPAK